MEERLSLLRFPRAREVNPCYLVGSKEAERLVHPLLKYLGEE